MFQRPDYSACQILRTFEENYVERINVAIDYIIRNLDQRIRLDDVAHAACFSPFHFHRVFRALLGETLNQFVKRQRLERALFLMSHAPNRSLTVIALECGFSSSSDFSRCFKQRYGVPPSVFDLKTFRDSRRGEFEAALDGALRLEEVARAACFSPLFMPP